MEMEPHYKPILLGSAFCIAIFAFAYFIMPALSANKIKYSSTQNTANTQSANTKDELSNSEVAFKATHIETPSEVKGIYMSGYVASSKSVRAKVMTVFDNSSLNAIVIDIKDYRGKIFFELNDPVIAKIGSVEDNIKDITEFINYLHGRNIYVIGRVSSFQDSYLAQSIPEYAVTKSDMKTIWKDKKGIMWVDPGNKKVWEYLKIVAEKSYNLGFDEINFDYIRFPSDGNMKDIYFPMSEQRFSKQLNGNTVRFEKSDVIMEFFKYMSENLRPQGIKISADVFGLANSSNDDLGIGQVLEKIVPYVDYISPMVYPSHYAPGANIADPEASPYETVKSSVGAGINKIKNINQDPNKMRPWIQDFSLRVPYGHKEVAAQIKALDDIGVKSYLVWDASNKYTHSVYKLTSSQ